MPSWANTSRNMHKACQLDNTAYLLAVPRQAVLMLQANNTGPMVEPSSSTLQQHAPDVAKLFQLYEDTRRKFSEYQKVLKCRQVLEKALKQVVLPGDYLVAHEQHTYPFSIIQVKRDVSAQDFTNNLEAEGLCTTCKPKTEKAFRTTELGSLRSNCCILAMPEARFACTSITSGLTEAVLKHLPKEN